MCGKKELRNVLKCVQGKVEVSISEAFFPPMHSSVHVLLC